MNNMMMIERQGVKKGGKVEIISYLLMSPDYTTVSKKPDEIIAILSKTPDAIVNMGLKDGKLVGTNGSLDNYNTFVMDGSTGAVEKTVSRAIILNRVEKNNKLIGYTMLTEKLELSEVSVQDAVTLAEAKKISNGKAITAGDSKIVAAIGGTYSKRVIDIKSAQSGSIKFDICTITKVYGTDLAYVMGFVSVNSVATASKVNSIIEEANAKITSELTAKIGNEKREIFNMINMSATKVFGAFPLKSIDDLAKNGATISAKKVIIEINKYDGSELIDMANNTILLDNGEYKINTGEKAESEKVAEELKKLTAASIKKLLSLKK